MASSRAPIFVFPKMRDDDENAILSVESGGLLSLAHEGRPREQDVDQEATARRAGVLFDGRWRVMRKDMVGNWASRTHVPSATAP